MRILVVRMSAMGDIIHAMPAIAALRHRFPEAVIGWALEERWTPLLTARPRTALREPYRGPEQPLVDVVHPTSLKRWKSDPFSSATRRAILSLRSELRAERYEIAVDLQGAIRSAVLARMSGAGKLIGESHPREYPARWWFDRKVETAGKHVIEQAHEVICALVGERLPLSCTEFPRDPAAERWAELWMRDNGVKRFAILNPGAGWGAKRWPADRYGRVAKKLKEIGVEPLVNAGPGEAALAGEVVDQSAGLAKMVESTIPQLIALTRRASLFVGGDTGPVHLASALQVPVVAIFGPTDPERNGPFHSRHVTLRHPESKRDHTRRADPEEGLLSICVEEVTDAALKMLSEVRG